MTTPAKPNLKNYISGAAIGISVAVQAIFKQIDEFLGVGVCLQNADGAAQPVQLNADGLLERWDGSAWALATDARYQAAGDYQPHSAYLDSVNQALGTGSDVSFNKLGCYATLTVGAITSDLSKLAIRQDTNDYYNKGLRVYGAGSYSTKFVGIGIDAIGETAILTTGNLSFYTGAGLRYFKILYDYPASGDVTFASQRNYTSRFCFSLPGGNSSAFVVKGQGNGNPSFVGINQLNPKAYLDILATSGTHLRLTYTDNSVYTDLSTSSTGHLGIMPSGGHVGIGTNTPTSPLQVVGLPVYANNAAAIAGGLTAGAFYRTGADPDPVCVVH